MSESREENLSKEEEKVEYSIPHTVTLKFPFDFGKERVESVTFTRRLEGGDLMELPAANIKLGDLVKLMCRCTGIAITVAKKMDAADLFECIDVVNSFFPSGPLTRENAWEHSPRCSTGLPVNCIGSVSGILNSGVNKHQQS